MNHLNNLLIFAITTISLLMFCPVSAYAQGGVPLWTNSFEALFSLWGKPIAVDSSGNVFVSSSRFTLKYSNEGLPLWTNLGGEALAVDARGNVFVTGYSRASDGSYLCTTIKYSSSIASPAYLDFQKLNNQLVLTWTNAGFNLQSAPVITGTFTNIPSATSPYTNLLTAPRQFFRLIGN